MGGDVVTVHTWKSRKCGNVSTYLEEEYCKCGYKPRREEVRLHTWKRRK
jgi:ribosomal protein L37E